MSLKVTNHLLKGLLLSDLNMEMDLMDLMDLMENRVTFMVWDPPLIKPGKSFYKRSIINP